MGKKKQKKSVEGGQVDIEDALEKPKKKMIAKRDFVLCWNEVHEEIKAGDDVSHIPVMFFPNLKTEGVI